jgi:glycosyltransferase involved in cell wall biosynthesis
MSHRSRSNDTNRPLQGLKLVVCGYELEQQEHRGIAVFTKGLLRSLKQAGAEVWLLTEFAPAMNDIRSRPWLPQSVQHTVFTSRLLDQLNSGDVRPPADNALIRRLRSMPLLGWTLSMLDKGQRFQQRLFPRRHIDTTQLAHVPADQLLSSPYQRCERLAYLRDIDGVLCADHCFSQSVNLAKRRASQTLSIDLAGFDGLITTSPLNLQPLNTRLFVQVVHDLIPLEYGRTRDHLPCFSRRLQATTSARRIYVSHDAEQKYNAAILSAGYSSDELTPTRVLTQCPSLQFPGDALDWEARSKNLKVLSSDQEELHSLEPCQFLLFNSSVVPHKNLLFALRAFMESGIERLGVQFCITGQPQHDAYSQAVNQLVRQHKNVIFTGYVDEATKRHLYLNALALISPSLVEGFGIPVLDAACLGLTALASPIGSHREIQAMHDFERHVLLCSTLNTSDWASAMRLVTLRHQKQLADLNANTTQLLLNRIRHERIQRYEALQEQVNTAFTAGVCELLALNA